MEQLNCSYQTSFNCIFSFTIIERIVDLLNPCFAKKNKPETGFNLLKITVRQILLSAVKPVPQISAHR
jgi:hypothetical protein